MALVEIHNLEVNLGLVSVLKSLDLRLEQGERMVIVGASGTGKTTLLRTLAGLIQPSAGQALIHGRPIHSIEPSRRGVAWLSQDYALYPQLSAGQNLEVALRQQRLSRPEIDSRIRQVCQWFDIGDLLERLPNQISGGQAQRVAFAKAIARRPELLLLDEPLSQLDSRLREQLIQSMIRATAQWGISVCWVAHDPWEAFAVASRVAVLDQGRIIQEGTPQKVYASPRKRLVAELCSPWGINWLPLDSAHFGQLASRAPNGQTSVGVRPEHWQLQPAGQPCFTVALTIQETRYLGFAQLASGLAGEAWLTLLDPAGILKAGDSVQVSVLEDHLIWVDEFNELHREI